MSLTKKIGWIVIGIAVVLIGLGAVLEIIFFRVIGILLLIAGAFFSGVEYRPGGYHGDGDGG